MPFSTRGFIALASIAGLLAALFATQYAVSCPFCSAVSLTFTEEIGQNDVAVIAKLTKLAKQGKDAAATSLDPPRAKFEIVEVLKGEKALGDKKEFEAFYFGENPLGTLFLVMGVEPPSINWATPIALDDRGRAYITRAIRLPKEGADRLAFFQDYLEDPNDMLARDAYDEFAKAPYSAVRGLKDRMKHDQIIEWIKNPQVPASRRRLYLTMLGVCGTAADSAVLEEMMKSKDRQTKAGLDALIAAYLTLRGPDGMPAVEDLFLKNKDAEYTDTYAAVMALRFHGQEEKIVPRQRLIEGLRHMLSRPQLADLVIPDLARWEDWGAMDKLFDLYKTSDDESSWVRVPVINYLRACPQPKAKAYLDEIAKLDPETYKRASSFFPFGGAVPPAAASSDRAKEKEKAAEAANAEQLAPKAGDAKAGEAKSDAGAGSAKAADKADDEAADAKSSAEKKSSKVPASKSGARAGGRANGASAIVAAGGGTGKLSTAQSLAAATSPARIFGGIALGAVTLMLLLVAILRGGQHAAA